MLMPWLTWSKRNASNAPRFRPRQSRTDAAHSITVLPHRLKVISAAEATAIALVVRLLRNLTRAILRPVRGLSGTATVFSIGV